MNSTAPGDVFGVLRVGSTLVFRKTVSESDTYLFAGITGDWHPNHTDEPYMATTAYGTRIVHGALVIGFMCTACSRLLETAGKPGVNYGFNRIRFMAPVYFGDTVVVEATISSLNTDARKALAEVSVRNQSGVPVAVGENISFMTNSDVEA